MNIRLEAKKVISSIPIRRAIILGVLLGWALLSTVIPVPAPDGGSGGPGPG